jgi:hypothetical protein
METKPIRMSQAMTECFTAVVDWNKQKTEVLFVPMWGNPTKFVGPGYWGNQQVEPPTWKYNTRVYSRQELIDAGAKSKMEYLWTR